MTFEEIEMKEKEYQQIQQEYNEYSKTMSTEFQKKKESIQQLQQEGYNAEFQSVDRTYEAYLSLCNLFYEKRIQLYSYPKFETEFFNLQHYRAKGKINHLPEYSKDCSDAVAGAIFNAMNSESISAALRKHDIKNILQWL